MVIKLFPPGDWTLCCPDAYRDGGFKSSKEMRMTIRSLLRGAVISAVAFGGSIAFGDSYKIDPVHSSAVFRTTHLGIGAAWGRFNDPSGTFTYSGDDLSFDVTLDMTKIDTANAKRDEHLRGPDFFNVKQFPTATFKSTGSKKVSDTAFEVSGDLTIRGITRPITLTLHKVGEGTDPWGGVRAGFEGEFTINRLDFGVSYMPDGLGHDVKLFVAFEGIRQ